MLQRLVFIRAFTTNILKAHGRGSTRKSGVLSQHCNINHTFPKGFQTFSPLTAAPPYGHSKIKNLISEDDWHLRAYKNLEKNAELAVANCSTTLADYQKERDNLQDGILKMEKEEASSFYPGWKDAWIRFFSGELRTNTRATERETSKLEDAREEHDKSKTAVALIELRTELFLRFRLAARSKLEDQLTAKILRVNKDYLAENIHHNLDRDFEYSFFLNQLKLDVLSGNLDSFLSGIGIHDSKDFLGICEFAFKGDQEAFFEYRPFGKYYIEEEVSDCENKFFPKFDRERMLELIGKVVMSESVPKNCVKMVDYLSKLSH